MECDPGMNRLAKVLVGAAAVVVAAVLPAVAADAYQQINVTIPHRVGIRLSPNTLTVEFPEGHYPPPVFPVYYGPSRGTKGSYTIEVFNNKNVDWTVSVGKHSGSPPNEVPITDWFVGVAEDPTAAPSRPGPGENPGSHWKPLPSSGTTVIITGSGKTNGWKKYNADLILKLTGDEEPTTADEPVTLVYTISTA